MTAPMEEYRTLDEAYTFFNARLFGGCLPTALIVLHRHKGARGYYHAQRFASRTQKNTHTDEIALNPDTFIARTDREILSTLAHEMVHQWQFHQANAPRTGYHNREWADKMEDIGLIPTTTGEPGGKRTGQRVTHYILEGGLFDHACRDFLGHANRLQWFSVPIPAKEKEKKNKTKYTCPECNLNAWAKPNARLICGECDTTLIEQ